MAPSEIAVAPRARLGRRWDFTVAAVLCFVAVLAVGWRPELAGFVYAACVSAELTRVDLAEHRLPNALVIPGFAFTAVGLVFDGLMRGTSGMGPVLAGVAAMALLLVFRALGALGMGDVKLGGLLATNLAVFGAAAALSGIILGFVAGGIAVGVIVFTPGAAVPNRMAFGPSLLAGFWVTVVVFGAAAGG